MPTLGGGRGDLYEIIWLYFPKLSMIVSNKWQFSQLKYNQLPMALRFTMYIRDFKLQNETKNIIFCTMRAFYAKKRWSTLMLI
jgi:hypothetical protein